MQILYRCSFIDLHGDKIIIEKINEVLLGLCRIGNTQIPETNYYVTKRTKVSQMSCKWATEEKQK
jgi:hypothetical protein